MGLGTFQSSKKFQYWKRNKACVAALDQSGHSVHRISISKFQCSNGSSDLHRRRIWLLAPKREMDKDRNRFSDAHARNDFTYNDIDMCLIIYYCSNLHRCFLYDLRWAVIVDRYSLQPPRSTEELQERYFGIISKLRSHRTVSGDQIPPAFHTTFNVEQERSRRYHHEVLYRRSIIECIHVCFSTTL